MRAPGFPKSAGATGRVVFFFLILAWPLLYQNSYALSNMRTAGLYALMAIGTNLIMGQAGQLSFGVMAFAGIGGYAAALTTVRLHWPPVLGLALGIVLACIVALLVGKPVLRLKLYFLALATMALVTIFTVIVSTARSITFGSSGVPGIPWLSIGIMQFDTFFKQYYFVWIAVIAVLLFCEAAMRSRVGRALHSTAVNETAASTLGVDAASWKLRAFVVSAGIAGFAGGLWALFLTSATPTDFSLVSAITVVIMVMVGGMESLFGSVVGAILITWLSYSLGSLQQYSGGVYALVLILLALFLPGGLARLLGRGWLHDRWLSRARSQLVLGIQAQPAFDAVSPASETLYPSRETASGDFQAPQVPATGRQGLRLEEVTVTFGGLTAVNRVSFETKADSITAIIGPNGAGKTTLFNAIFGLQKLSGGRLWYEGKELTGLTPVAIARLGLSRTFQNLRIFENMTVWDNVMVGRHRHEGSHFLTAGLRFPSQRREEQRSRDFCLKVLELVDLASRAEEMASSLPYGQQRLLEIARALATEPSLLLLDEPAAGMNDAERQVLREKILAIRASGIHVLIVEHDMELIMGLSDHVCVLDHGRLIAEGTPEFIRNHPEVIQAYLGAAEESERPPRVGHPERMAVIPEAQPDEQVLRVDGLSTYYGSIGAVRDVGFHVCQGECVAILGANGAGKTTLLRTICGSLRPRSGHVFLGPVEITHKTAPEIMELGVCQVLEGRHVFPTLSVQDNLILGAGKQRKRKGFSDDLASVFDLFPILKERCRQAAGSLSGGEQQMLAIGRALMGRPRILLLDEPSMGLAPLIVESIFAALRALNDDGLTLLMVEQNASAALAIADRAVVLVTGVVALTGSARELESDPRLHDLYLGRST